VRCNSPRALRSPPSAPTADEFRVRAAHDVNAPPPIICTVLYYDFRSHGASIPPSHLLGRWPICSGADRWQVLTNQEKTPENRIPRLGQWHSQYLFPRPPRWLDLAVTWLTRLAHKRNHGPGARRRWCNLAPAERPQVDKQTSGGGLPGRARSKETTSWPARKHIRQSIARL